MGRQASKWGRWWEGATAAHRRPGRQQKQQPGQEAAGRALCTDCAQSGTAGWAGGSSQVWMGQAPSSCSLISCLSAENLLRD